MNKPVDLTPIQRQFVTDDTRFKVVTAGRRSRKTLLARWQLQTKALARPGRYFLGAPTRQQSKFIFWEALKTDMRPVVIGKPNETDLILNVYAIGGRSEIQVLGLMAGERVEGRPWDGCVITEFDDVLPGVWSENVRPALSDTNGWAIIEGVPEGRGPLYQFALDTCGGVIPETRPVEGAYRSGVMPDWAFYTWFSADVLPATEIEQARRDLDERTFRQEYEGAFGSMGGQAYHAFGEHNLDRTLKRDNSKPVYVGMDFNVDPMTAVLLHVDRVGKRVDQWGEIWLPISNTWEMADQICKRLGVEDPRGITVIPDATGAARSSNSVESDIAILRRRGFMVTGNASNPKQRDRLAAVNSLMMTAAGDVRYRINPEACPKTIRDFNRVELLPDGRIDKSNEAEGIGHISDALGYVVNYYFPVRQRIVGAA